METTLTFSNFWRHPRFWRHFWAWFIFLFFASLLITSSVVGNPDEEFKQEMSKISVFIFGIFVMIYAAFYAYNTLQPRKKYVQIALAFIIIMVATSFFNEQFGVRGIRIGDLKGFFANLTLYPFILLAAFGFKLAYHGGRQLFVIERLRTKQVESELKLLKSQVNPHFLFNTLNNIYATNLDDHESANEIILELADLLRYQLKSQSKTTMPLKEEIAILKNYISLEKIRIKDCKIELEERGDFQTLNIVPLLLLPFVENAFKYGTGIESGQIDLKFILDEANIFTFYCRNKIVQKKGKVHSGGIGLENVKKRLALKYGGNYHLDLKEKNGYFIVELKIKNLDKN